MTRLAKPELEAARHLLWAEGYPNGWEPGSFSKNLIRAFQTADQVNRARLWIAFPEYRTPMLILQNEGGDALTRALIEAAER